MIQEGIITANIIQVSSSDEKGKVDSYHIRLLWETFFKVSGIDDLDRVPNTSDPNTKDVKICMYIWSMESFIYKVINKASRENNSSYIRTLGPYAVLISRVISRA